ncbi:MAG: YihY/virulence factor BrkB family protein [Gammaproteobacteria bacterium]|nr:YihY/virulence factor BrkB family protein [Gammaproteobacteria bacterium]
MLDSITRLRNHLQEIVWSDDLRQLPAWRRLLIGALRLGQVLLRELARGELNLRAMSMVYTTLLSMVPLLAVSFSVLKGFGVHNQLEPVLHQFLAPLGPKGDEIAGHLLTFVSNMDVSVLGGLGLAMLIYTVLSLLHKIEAAFNHVWQIERTRGFGQRFSSYLSVVLVGPVLVFGALAITASVMNNRLVQWLIGIEPFGTLVVESSRLIPYLLVVGAFTFFYTFIPNTRVKLYAALGGGLVAGLLWQSTGWIFAAFIASSTQYAAIYSSFAILVLLLIWLYINWLILLIGAQISFLIQNPHYLTRTGIQLGLSNRLKERLALNVMYLIADQHHRHAAAWTVTTLAARLNVPVTSMERLVALLIAAGYLVETCDEPPNLIAAQDTASVRLVDLLDAVRAADEGVNPSGSDLADPAPIGALLQRLQAARGAALADMTLLDLLSERRAD